MRFDKENSRRARRTAAIKAGGAQNRRLLFMAGLFVLVVIALFSANAQRQRLREGNPSKLPVEGSPTEVVALPAFDAAALDGLVRDAEPGERVLSEPEALDRLLSYVALLTPAHYGTLGTRELTAEVADELAHDPSGHRAEAYHVRGYVETIRERKRDILTQDASRTRTEYHGTLRLEDGSAAHFVVLDAPASATIDSFLRIDGLFLKLYSTEGDDGWVEAPLLVGTRAVRSYRSLAYSGEPGEKPEHLLATVIDDKPTLTGLNVAPVPHEAQWALMAYARDLVPDAVDWESTPELNSELMREILRDGRAFRGQPMRFPVVRLQDAWVEDAGENPARIERVTVGWIGSWEWNQVGVVKFLMPFSARRLETATNITARGFFFRNHAYQTRNGSWIAAPLFVMHSVDVFVQPELTVLNWILYGLGVLTIVLGVLFWVLLRRDRKKSRALREVLKRRRKARRSSPPQATPAPQGRS